MMVVHCCKIKKQRAEETEARGAVRRTGEGHRKGEVEGVEDKLLVFQAAVVVMSRGCSSSYHTHSLCCLPDQEMAVTSSGIQHLPCLY